MKRVIMWATIFILLLTGCQESKENAIQVGGQVKSIEQLSKERIGNCIDLSVFQITNIEFNNNRLTASVLNDDDYTRDIMVKVIYNNQEESQTKLKSVTVGEQRDFEVKLKNSDYNNYIIKVVDVE